MADGIANGFIDPDSSLRERPFSELHDLLDVAIFSGHQADFAPYLFADRDFREIVTRINVTEGYEDQCSAKYYFDMCRVVLEEAEQIDRIVEVGVYMGGASVLLAGCAEKIDAELVMIDINDRHLQFSFERLRRSFPEAAERTRLFHGDLPTYVRDVLLPEAAEARIMVQLDGSHAFEDVVRDLGSLYYVRERLQGLMVQDTHLRGMPKGARFIDAAVFGVFGGDMQYVSIGSTYDESQTELVTPNRFGGNYFLPGKPEGMYLPMSHNQFEYPHPSIRIEDFFW